jgi:ADP-dependent phosphofructokinase/glucokinase
VSLQKTLIETVGWLGVAAIVGAYSLVSFEVLEPSRLSFQLLNLGGAIGIIISSLSKKDYQPVVLNVIWLTVAATAIITVIW